MLVSPATKQGTSFLFFDSNLMLMLNKLCFQKFRYYSAELRGTDYNICVSSQFRDEIFKYYKYFAFNWLIVIDMEISL